jgi:hypothetical protein
MGGNEPAQLLGLASGSMAGAFTSTQSAISLIYDSMKVEWNNGAADPQRMPSTNFAIVASPAARGQTIRLDLRGFSMPAGAGSVQLEIGGAQSTATSDDEDFVATVTATLSADADTTPVTVTLDLPKPADEAVASLTLDSIDVSLPDCSSAREI